MISWTVEDVERRAALLGLRLHFGDEERENLTTTHFVVPDEGMVCFPTPTDNRGLNLLNLRQLLGTNPAKQPSFFDHPWYLDEAFARENCPPGWHCLLSSVLPDSIAKPMNYVHSLWTRGYELPTAVEVVLMIFLHYAETREQLLNRKHTWCRDRASLNRFVTVGAFGRNGLFVSGHPPEFASRGLGICAKLRGDAMTGFSRDLNPNQGTL